MSEWRFERVELDVLPMDLAAESFRNWFRREPWLEVARCPSCSPLGDYGSAGRYAAFVNDGWCPVCGEQLEEYWSDERVQDYFLDAATRPGYGLYVMKGESGIVAWASVYSVTAIPELADLGSDWTYVDTFGFTMAGAEKALDLFEWGHREEQKRGATYFVYRTHRDAIYIHELTARFGYVLLRECRQEDDRQYHIYLPEPLA